MDNRGKVAIIRCALVGLGASGVSRVALMPESYGLGEQALRGLARSSSIPQARVLEMAVVDGPEDSRHAAELMRQAGAGCILVLGGDGTVRDVSKGAGQVPLLPISTGTNNVLPTFVEGTVAGVAAGALATGRVGVASACLRHKWLEVRVNGTPTDRALVDAAFVRGRFLGSRAVWQVSQIEQLVVTRAQAHSIGMSAIAGVLQPVAAEEPRGVALSLSPSSERPVMAAIGPGLIAEVGIGALRTLQIGDSVDVEADGPLIVALDGEREVALRPSDRASIVLRADGPWIVDVGRTMNEMVKRGLFNR